MILVSLASWPPITTTSPPTKVVAPPPLEARGRSGMLDQVPSATSKQSTRAVVGERPPATHTAPPSTKPIRWFRGWGSGGSTVQAFPLGSYDSSAETLPRAVLPPTANSFPATAA